MASRNLALDFFRGLALLVIFVNHMPGNPWYWYTPSRFGFSDAAEAFVFLSGYSCALAYGRRFETDGFWRATQRVMRRWLKIYAAHLLSFVLMLGVCLLGDRWAPEMNSWQRLNMDYFFNDMPSALVDVMTLRYVPNYFDILPLYLLLLAGLPLFWLLSRIHVAVAIAASLYLYWAAAHFGWSLIGDPRAAQPWYFNPMNWQLMFFSGFAIASGWLKLPAGHRGWLGFCFILITLAIPSAYQPLYSRFDGLNQLHLALEPWLEKHRLGTLRWLHLLVLAYLIRELLLWRRQWLQAWLPSLIVSLGQNSLSLYLAIMALSYLAGVFLLGCSLQSQVAAGLVNLAGMAILLAIARLLKKVETSTDRVAGLSVASRPSALSRYA